MRRSSRSARTWPVVLAVCAFAWPFQGAVAQETMDHGETDHDAEAHAAHPSLLADLGEDIALVKNKLLGLAEAIPEKDYDWRPADGVRSVRETLLHVAADNYFIPMALGAEPPARTGITDDYATTKRFEERPLSKGEVESTLEGSFVFLQRVLDDTAPAGEGELVNLFGRQSTVQQAWILITTHLHEHLGQMIAYARANDVTPPWSM